ncbi:integrase catalytic domain-containing protein [Serratia marcescens]|uniref:integrase catalytic domain-containing protein n=1 Tax=Serratia marcescens TaxID=615 RepID=UPI000B00B15A
MDALASGCWIKCLTCVDDFTKECLAITTAFGISYIYVSRILDSTVAWLSGDDKNRTGPEFTCRVLDQWAFEHGVELRLIQPEKSTQH